MGIESASDFRSPLPTRAIIFGGDHGLSQSGASSVGATAGSGEITAPDDGTEEQNAAYASPQSEQNATPTDTPAIKQPGAHDTAGHPAHDNPATPSQPRWTAQERTAPAEASQAQAATAKKIGRRTIHGALAEGRWDGPPPPAPIELNKFKKTIEDLASPAIADRVGALLRASWTNGGDLTEIERGQSTERIYEPNQILRVVHDLRIEGGDTPTFNPHDYTSAELFDEEAQSMIRDVLYRGPAILARVRRYDGSVVDVGRSVGFFRPSSSGLRLIGRTSDTALQRGTPYVEDDFSTVGSVDRYEKDGRQYVERLSRAQIITPRSASPRGTGDTKSEQAKGLSILGAARALRERGR
jgi:hypothetical protein